VAKFLIVNADDLGISPSVNDAVMRAHWEGIVTSASLMVNMPYCHDAVEGVRRHHPSLGVGLHISLTSGRPVLPPEAVPRLVDEDGMFRLGVASLSARLRSSRRTAILREIDREMHAQCARADALGIQLDHLDSHQHVHMIPAVHGLAASLAADRGLPLRSAREPWGALRPRSRRLATWLVYGGLLKRDMLARNAGIIARRHRQAAHADHYFGILDSGRMSRAAWLAIAASLVDGVTEVNVHPAFIGRPDRLVCSRDDHRFFRSPHRAMELHALLDPGVRAALSSRQVTLTRFADVFDSATPRVRCPREAI